MNRNKHILLSVLLSITFCFGIFVVLLQPVCAATTPPTNCPVCGSTNITQAGDWFEPDPSTQTDGSITMICNDCEDAQPFTVILHVAERADYVKIDHVDPTCTTAGKDVYECPGYSHSIVAVPEKCHDQYTVTIPASGHTPVTIPGKAATCTESGLTDGSKCSVCGAVLKGQTVIPAKGHSEVIDAAKNATCTEDGLTEGSHCDVCNTILKTQTVIPAKGHSEVTDAAKNATCTENGLTEGSHCSVCSTVFKAQTIIPAKGHVVVSDKAKKATCTEDGLTEGSHCSVCDAVIKSQEVIKASGHKWDEGKITKKATENKEGVMTFACLNCKEKRTEVIPKLENKDDPQQSDTPNTPTTPKEPSSNGNTDDLDPSEDPLKNKSGIIPLAAIIAGCGAAAAVITTIVKKRHIPKPPLPDLSRKYIALALGNNGYSEEITKLFAGKRYLKTNRLSIDDRDAIASEIKNEGPDLIILELDKDHDLDSLTKLMSELNEEEGSTFAILADPQMLDDTLESKLKELQNDSSIIGFAASDSKDLTIIKLILPIYKPELSFDDGVKSVGSICDLLGIEGISAITGLYSAGKNIIDTAKKDDSLTNAASIIGSIAEILGWEKVSEVTDLIDQLDENKGYFEEEIQRQKILNDAE